MEKIAKNQKKLERGVGMPKNKKAPGVDMSGLPELSANEHQFIELLMFDPSVDGNASEAYRRAYPNSKANNQSLYNLASRLRGSEKVQKWLSYYKALNMERLNQSRERYAADLKGMIHRAEQTGNYGAAMSGVKLLGSVYGHLNADAKNPRDREQDLKDLIAIAKESKEGEKYAMQLAAQVGMLDKLKSEMETLH